MAAARGSRHGINQTLVRGDGNADCINPDLVGRLTGGEKACSWDLSLIEHATRRLAARRPRQLVVTNWLAYVRAAAVGDYLAAACPLETALANCFDAGSEMRQMFFREAAFLEVRYHNEIELAGSWFDRRNTFGDIASRETPRFLTRCC